MAKLRSPLATVPPWRLSNWFMACLNPERRTFALTFTLRTRHTSPRAIMANLRKRMKRDKVRMRRRSTPLPTIQSYQRGRFAKAE